jgi:hypothetical protein
MKSSGFPSPIEDYPRKSASVADRLGCLEFEAETVVHRISQLLLAARASLPRHPKSPKSAPPNNPFPNFSPKFSQSFQSLPDPKTR